jgi:hypothetical protein
LVAVRSVTVQAKALPGAFRGAKRPGVMRAIKGNIGAERAEKWNSFEKIAVKQRDNARNSLNPVECGSCGFFRRRGAEQKKMLGVPGLRRRISPFARTGSLNRFRLL